MHAIVESALRSAEAAERFGLAHDKIILSAKVSNVQNLIDVYEMLAARCDYPLHLGLTEAGLGSKGIVATTAALSILLQQGIGDTIRASLTPLPNGDRTEEVIVCQQILQSLGLAQLYAAGRGMSGLRPYNQYVFPGHGRPDSKLPSRADADLAGKVYGRRRDESRGDGLRGERSWRIEARRYRHLATRNV